MFVSNSQVTERTPSSRHCSLGSISYPYRWYVNVTVKACVTEEKLSQLSSHFLVTFLLYLSFLLVPRLTLGCR